MQKTITHLEQVNQTTQGEKNKLVHDLESAKRKIADLQAELEALRNSKENLQLENDDLQKR